jgi:aminoglycoside/choline kinase family phosphotransferase
VCLDAPLENPEIEPSFLVLQKVLESEGVRVPKIYDRELNTGYILEEDLGDTTYLKEISQINSKEKEFEYYRDAIRLMDTIHKVKVKKFQEMAFTKLAFDKEKLYAEMEFSKKYFLARLMGIDIENSAVKILYEKLDSMCDYIAKEPRVLVHRDYHSRNLMIVNNEQVVIDFQDARMGTPLYDLVSLLEDCYYSIDPENKTKLVDFYFENYFKKFDPAKTKEDFLKLYDYVAIQRVYKAIGSFAFIYADRKDLRYLKYIGYAFEKVRMIMFKYPEFNEVRKLLSGLYYAT